LRLSYTTQRFILGSPQLASVLQEGRKGGNIQNGGNIQADLAVIWEITGQ